MQASKAVKGRLRKKTEFEKVLSIVKPWRGKRLSIWILDRKDNKAVRLGLIVGKAVSRSAVKRNRWKRQIREAVKNFQSQATAGRDVVIKPHGGQESATSKEIREDFERALARLK